MSGKVVREQDTFGSSVTKTPSRRVEGPSSPPSVDPEDRSCVRAIKFSIPGGGRGILVDTYFNTIDLIVILSPEQLV